MLDSRSLRITCTLIFTACSGSGDHRGPRARDLITHNGGNLYFFADMLRYVDEALLVVVLDNAFEFSHLTHGSELAAIAFADCG